MGVPSTSFPPTPQISIAPWNSLRLGRWQEPPDIFCPPHKGFRRFSESQELPTFGSRPQSSPVASALSCPHRCRPD